MSSAGKFEQFFDEAWPWAVRLAVLLVGDQAVAEDIVQQSLLRVYSRFEEIENPGAYLRRSVINGTHNRHRDEALKRAKLPLLREPLESIDAPTEMADMVATLPIRQRTVIVLRYYADMSESEIAEVLECQPGTVKSLASRALARLAREVRDDASA